MRTILIVIVGLVIVLQIPELSDYVTSIIDFQQKHTAVGGSSFDMRLSQLEGCFSEITNSPLIGKGFGWHLYYIEKYGDHPILLAFESLIFVVLCDNGVLGLLIWFGFVSYIIYNSQQLVKKDRASLYALVLFYIIYCCFTGEYNYLRLFLLVYVISVADKSFQSRLSIDH